MIVRCPQCQKALAMVAAGTWLLKHAKREYVCRHVDAIRCDECRSYWHVRELPGGQVVLTQPDAA